MVMVTRQVFFLSVKTADSHVLVREFPRETR